MKISKKTIKQIIAEELENMGLSDNRGKEIDFMIQKTWIGQISEDENILELCNILAPAVLDEPKGERFSIGQEVRRVFESCQQKIIEDLQRIADDRELEN